MEFEIKALAKRMARPVARPLLVRFQVLQDAADTQMSTAESMLLRLDRIEQAVTKQARQIEHVGARTEFIRRELMYEMRYGGKGPGVVEASEPKIVNRASLDHRPLRLNLGCGHLPLPGFVNIDCRSLDNVDVVAEVGNLPFDAGTVDEIYSAHLLEHFPLERTERLLRYWFSLLAPGGVFRAVVPDAKAMVDAYSKGSFSWASLREVTFGAQEYDGDFHFAMYSHDDLSTLLETTGFEEVTLLEGARPNGLCLEMEILARRLA